MSRKWIAPVGVVLVLLGGVGLWYYLAHRITAQPVAQVAPPPPALPTEPVIQHPIPDAQSNAAQTPLPALNDSDPAMLSGLDALIGAPAVKEYVIRENV